jgi:tetratricopeptide (TPR) repeat protein
MLRTMTGARPRSDGEPAVALLAPPCSSQNGDWNSRRQQMSCSMLARACLRALRTFARCSFIVMALGAVSTAFATEPSTGEHSSAEQLFAEGRKLMSEERYEEACTKLAHSQRLDPGGGTLLNLALCHEAQGRYASAWTELHEALNVARKDGRRDREKMATEFLAAVELKVSYLVFRLDPAIDTPGLVLQLDGAVLGRSSWEKPVPIDPGIHEIAVSATGKQPRNITVTVSAIADYQAVTIPVLDAMKAARAATQVASTAAPTHGNVPVSGQKRQSSAPDLTRRNAGLIVLGGSVIAVAVGSVLGVEAIGRRKQSDSYCTGNVCAELRGVELNDDAQRLATYANVAFGAGLVAAVVGTYLTLTSGNAASPPTPVARGGMHHLLRSTTISLPSRKGSLGLEWSW